MLGPVVFAAGAVPYAVSLLAGAQEAGGVHWNPLVRDVHAELLLLLRAPSM